MLMTDRLTVNVSEAAALLSVSRPVMYQILNREDFTADFRIGSKHLISVKGLEEWIDKQTATSAQ